MKHFKRVMAFVLMLAMVAGIGFLSPLANKITVYAAENIVGEQLVVEGLRTKANIDEYIRIPEGSATGGKTVEVVIKNPRGMDVTEFLTNEDTDYEAGYLKFKPEMLGTYTVQYTVVNGLTKSQIYCIRVVGTKPQMDFVTNAEIYLPETIYASKDVIIPTPIITDKNGDEVASVVAKIRGTETAVAGENVVYVSCVAPNYENVALTRNADNQVVLKAIKNTEEEYVYGKYILTFFYQASDGLTATKQVEVKVQQGYKEDFVDKIKLTYDWKNGESFPKSGVLGKELKLPIPVAKDELTGTSLQSYTSVKIDFVPNGDLSATLISYNGTDKKDFNNNTFSFVPMHKTENGGYYRIVYTITDYFGHTKTETKEIGKKETDSSGITDTVKPEFYLVEDYTAQNGSDGNVDLSKDMSYLIPHKVIVSCDNAIILPAAYAVDNYVDFENLTIRRYWISENESGTSVRTKIDETKNADGRKVELKFDDESLDEVIRNCLKTAGTYQVRYEVTDGSNTASIPFEIIVVERDFVDSVAPRITMNSIGKAIYAGETITFASPVVKDYSSEDLKEENLDTLNCYVEVGYYAGNNYAAFINDYRNGKAISECVDGDNFHFINKVKDKDFYSFDVAEDIVADKIYVVVRAIDNAQYGSPNNIIAENNVNVKSFEVNVIKLENSGSVSAPTFDASQISGTLLEVDQESKVKIESTAANGRFTFVGTNPETITINVYDPSGKEVSVKGMAVNKTLTTISVANAYFYSSVNGNYTVCLTATDLYGNSTVVSYAVKVLDTIAPELDVKKELEVVVNEEATLPEAILKDGGAIIENQATTKIEVVDGEYAYSYDEVTNIFVAHESGEYTVKYYGFDGVNSIEKTMIIIAKASASEVSMEFDDTAWVDAKPLIQVGTTGKYEKIEIPYLSILNDINGLKAGSYTVKVVGPNDKAFAVSTENASSIVYGEFEPTRNGEYRVTYTAYDNAGRKVEVTKTLRVGDMELPQISILNSLTNLPTSAKLNSTLSINPEDIVLSDNVTSTDRLNLVITIKDSEGKSINLTKENGLYSYTFAKAGTYTLTYTVSDEAGNSAPRSTTIVVEAKSNTESVITSIISMVLIVLFVVLCTGIIVYFIVINKKKVSKEDLAKSAKSKIIE